MFSSRELRTSRTIVVETVGARRSDERVGGGGGGRMARAFGEGNARSAGALPGPKVDLPSGLIPKKVFFES